jgi:hypothetical protein
MRLMKPLVFGLAFAVLALTALSGSPQTAHAACGANPCITVDADDSLSGVQVSRTVPTGSTFSVFLEATGAAAEAGYQWEIGWDDPTLNFVSSTEMTLNHGATLCGPPALNPGVGLAGMEVWGGGAGCFRSSGTFGSGPGPDFRMTEIELQCTATGYTDLHLVYMIEDPFFGSSFLAPGGLPDSTDLAEGFITCTGAPPPPPVTCQPILLGDIGLQGGQTVARVGAPLRARATIPAGKTNMTLRVVGPLGDIRAQQGWTGVAGDLHQLGFQGIRPGPLTVECLVDNIVESSTQLEVFLIDPSGEIYDLATTASIVGAEVTLETDSDPGAGEAWVPMDVVTHAGFFDPLINPETSGLDGRYAWDVAPYYPQGNPDPTNDYRVVVRAHGCEPKISPVVTVPPEVTDLDVGLVCPDTDGDGLADYVEISQTGTSPDLSDTDGDTIPDDQEDPDGDGLNNDGEILAGSDPLVADSDGDTLSDGAEVGLGTSPLIADTENDNCSDKEETGASQSLGGLRDPAYAYDFFDVPLPAGPDVGVDGKLLLRTNAVRNRAITLSDASTVLSYVGRTSANQYYVLDRNGDGTADGEQLDRTPSTTMGQPWRSRAPNGAISLQDVSVMLAQVGHSCIANP